MEARYESANCTGTFANYTNALGCQSAVSGYELSQCVTDFSLNSTIPQGSFVTIGYVPSDAPSNCTGDIGFVQANLPKACFQGVTYWCKGWSYYMQSYKDTLCTKTEGQAHKGRLGCVENTATYCQP